jgi:hypothetical protein
VSPYAGNASGYTAEQVNANVAPALKNALGKLTQIPKAPHVERNMEDTDVDKGRSE